MLNKFLIPMSAGLLGLLAMPASVRGEPPAAAEAQFRGCDAAGWCRFSFEAPQAMTAGVHRVRPDGVAWTPDLHAACDEAMAIAVRDRLNALLSGMIHQHKRIGLERLRELDDGSFAATVTVNGGALAADAVLLQLREDSCAAGESG